MDLYTAATRDGGIRLLGDITLINFGRNHDVIVVRTADFTRVRRFAEAESASMLRPKDINRFIELFEVRVARPGANFGTMGSAEALLHIAHGMAKAGMEYNSWNLPSVVKQAIRQHPPPMVYQAPPSNMAGPGARAA